MSKRKKLLAVSWLMALMMLFNVLSPLSTVYAVGTEDTEAANSMESMGQAADTDTPAESAESAAKMDSAITDSTKEESEAGKAPSAGDSVPGRRAFSAVAASERDASVLQNLVAAVTQNGQEISETDIITSNAPIHVAFSFTVPVEGDEPTPSNPVKKGDVVSFDLSNAFTLANDATMELESGGTLVGHVSFSKDPDSKMVKATVIFDGADDIFNGTLDTIECKFGANFNYNKSGDEDDWGDRTVAILNKSYTVNVPAPAIEYKVVKKGTPNLDEQSVTWEVEVSATQGSHAVDLAGYQFFDELKDAGEYIPGSFTVGGVEADPVIEGTAISYVLASNAEGKQAISFKTKIPDKIYYAVGTQNVHNNARLLDNEEEEVKTSGDIYVPITPKEWIKKEGESSEKDKQTGTYDPTNRTITWTITVNENEAELDNAIVTDKLPAGSTFKSAVMQEWDGSSWGAETPVSVIGNEYQLGNINSKVKLTIVTNIPDNNSGEYTTEIKTYKNKASLKWDNIPAEVGSIETGEIPVTIGYDSMKKTGEADTANQKIRWTVSVDTRGQNIPDLKVYDLLVYDKNTDLSAATGIPAGINLNDLTVSYGQKYIENFSGSGAIVINPIAIMQDGKRVGDLLEITGLSVTEANEFSFDTKVLDPDVFASNTTKSVGNTASLFTDTKKIRDVPGGANYANRILQKELLKREAIADPAAGVNTQITNNAEEGFDYKDKSAIFRINVNADGIDVTAAKNGKNESMGDVTVTDALPEGWEFVEIAPEEKYQVFEGEIPASGNSIQAIDTTPDTVTGLSANFNAKNSEVTFTFTSLTKPYVILVKAKPTAKTLADYFKTNNVTQKTNTLSLKTEVWDGNVKDWQNITVKSTILEKTLTTPQPGSNQLQAGELLWTVDYKPYELDQRGNRLEDKIPVGIDLRTDSHGTLLLEPNVTATEMILKADGEYELGDTVPLELGTNIEYDNATRKFTFIIPEKNKAYRFTYITDITGETGEIKNEVSLLDVTTNQEQSFKTYTISSYDASASFQRRAAIQITKIDGSSGTLLPGAEFALLAIDGTTVIRSGITDSSGSLRLKCIPDGEYILKEITPPAAYTLDESVHSLTVTTEGSVITASIDGKTGPDANTLTLKNYKEGTTGSLTISKTVAGNAADETQQFDFTVTFTGADGTYDYVGKGIADGTIQSGDTISLAHGQSITIKGLPKDAAYTVTEKDYTDMGYAVASTDETGTIIADTTAAAVFTNTKNAQPIDETGSLTISKTVTGQNADLNKKFKFTVHLVNAPDAYAYTGAVSGTLQSDDAVFLAHGESITITGLPKDAQYKVTEEDYSKEGYTAASTGESGVIAAGSSQTAAFTNTYKKTPDPLVTPSPSPTPVTPQEPETPSKPETPTPTPVTPEEPETPSKPGTPSSPEKGTSTMPKTGDTQNVNPALFILIFSGTALLVFSVIHFTIRKKYTGRRYHK